jgi:hypothetical protein
MVDNPQPKLIGALNAPQPASGERDQDQDPQGSRPCHTALLRHLSYGLILSLTTTSVRLLQRAIGEHCGLCLALLAWIDRNRLLRDLTRVAIDEALETWDEVEDA